MLAIHGKKAMTIARRITKKTKSIPSKREPKITDLLFSKSIHYEHILYKKSKIPKIKVIPIEYLKLIFWS